MSKTLLMQYLLIGTAVFGVSQVQAQSTEAEPAAPAAAADADLMDMSLEDLMNVKVSVSTKGSSQNLRQTPSAVTVITAEDIKENHARDMVDILNMVPGLNVTKDLDDRAVTARGLYGFEGRALVMWDGMQLNDLVFGTYNFGDDLPIHRIERIEIIRGPGSVLYGGTAELAVINIISKNGGQLNGTDINVRYGTLPKSFGHRDISARFGKKNDDWEYSSIVNFGESMMASGTKEAGDPAWTPDMEHRDDSALFANKSFNLKTKYKDNAEFKMYYQNQINNQVTPCAPDSTDPTLCMDTDAYRISQGAGHPIYFYNYGGEGGYEFNLGESLKFKPVLSVEHHSIWVTKESEDLITERAKLSAPFSWAMDKFDFVAGAEAWVDTAKVNRKDGVAVRTNLRKSKSDEAREYLAIMNNALYASGNYNMEPFFFTAGIRYDKNEIFGDATSPRVGMTYVDGPLHSKLLFANAFRAPLFGNNAVSSWGFNPARPWREDVKPEKTQVTELEVGYLLTENLSVVGNIFDQQVKDVIEYAFYDDTQTGVPTVTDLFSKNGETIGTQGAEVEFKYKQKGVYSGLLNFSYVTLSQKGGKTYLNYSANAGENNSRLLGVPTTKVYTNHSYSITDKISVQANLLYLSEKDAERWGDPNLYYMEQYKVPAQTIYGLGLLWDEAIEGLDVSLSIHDLTDQRLKVVTPYKDSGFAPITWKGREYLASLTYTF